MKSSDRLTPSTGKGGRTAAPAPRSRSLRVRALRVALRIARRSVREVNINLLDELFPKVPRSLLPQVALS